MGGKLYFEDLLVNKRAYPTSYEREALEALHMSSFLDPWEYIKYLEEAGFRVDQYEDRTE